MTRVSILQTGVEWGEIKRMYTKDAHFTLFRRSVSIQRRRRGFQGEIDRRTRSIGCTRRSDVPGCHAVVQGKRA